MDEFINPKSMLTPGVAGSLMMFLVNGITFQFPEVPARYLALLLSFFIGAVVWFAKTKGKSPIFQKMVYWVLNSLVIFVVGFGTANLAVDASADHSKTGAPHVRFMPQIVSTAYAQTDPTRCPSPAPRNASSTPSATVSGDAKALEERLAREKAENERLKQQLELEQKRKQEGPRQEGEKQFFKRW